MSKDDAPAQDPTSPRRRCVRWVLLVLAALLPSALDVTQRAPYLRSFERAELAFYFCSAAVSGLLWSALLHQASLRSNGTRASVLASRVARLLLGLLALATLGVQQAIFAHYRAFLDYAAALVGTTLLPDIAMMRAAPARYALSMGGALIYACATPWLLGRISPTRTRAPWRGLDLAVAAILTAAFVSPSRGADQGATFDTMMLSAFGQVARARWEHNETVLRVHPGARTPRPLPTLPDRPALAPERRRRDIIILLNESLRAASHCTAFTQDCPYTPFSNEAARDRIPLLEFRALDSTTAISLGVLLTGLRPTATREETLSAPVLWEYARAAGYRVGYYTSQHLLFGNQGKLVESVPFDRSRCATQLEWNPGLDCGADDARAVDAALADLGALGSPHVSVVHLSNTHYPYAFEESDAPFLPQSSETGPYYAKELKNRYHDVVYHQDRSVARLVEGLKRRGHPTVLVYLSDHGEQLHEHGVHGHTGSVYDAEIRVPLWFLSIAGGLSEAETRALRALRTERLLMLDMLPTLLDLAGVWRRPEWEHELRNMAGESLLRGGSPRERPEVLTNCTGIWGCSYPNWGVIAGPRKLIAHKYSPGWQCFDLTSDPNEQAPKAPTEGCADLVPIAEQQGRPFGH